MHRIEKEANQFAMELLMPQEMFDADIKNYYKASETDGGNMIKWLSERYQVSETTVALRIGQLGFRGRINL